MNSIFTHTEQQKICSEVNKKHSTNMEMPEYNTDIIFDENLYTISWNDIENTEIDYDNYLNEIENFFREDFENDILEEEIFSNKRL
ncbi:hypothetical protein [Chryseobacterium sp.]|uniref:hypothetical protein n=1 Tax=Chryseobacterium sp. TaxID=1871047 RepID=UPI002606F10B|nr:hypothetical protein [Chryseobacterium sp.]